MDKTPECDESIIRAYLGQRFSTIDEGVEFYKRYAVVASFDVRCSIMRKTRDGNVKVKYLLVQGKSETCNQMK
nr:protein FAR1-RELATED SEQUENCE 5-like [Ipomoea batatas]